MQQPVEIVPCDFDRIAREELPQATRIAQYLAAKHPGARVLDVGCGPGIYVTEMRKAGLQAFGVDNDPRLEEYEFLTRCDITKIDPIEIWPHEFDVVLSLEVGEHLPPDAADRYVDFISGTGAAVLYFSAARPGQGGEGHINLQDKDYWVRRFHLEDFWVDLDETYAWLGFMRQGYHLGWLTQNGICLRRA
jgi:SAM-dependent methyltransferase